MNKQRPWHQNLILFGLLNLSFLSACDSPAALTASFRSETVPQLELQATLTNQAQGGRTLQITDPTALPAALRQAPDIKAIVDNSNTRIPVNRNSDGSLSFNLPANIQLKSDGSLFILLSASQAPSQPVRLLTGPALDFKTPAFQISPAATVTQGTQLTLKANLAQPEKATDYEFNWSYATSAAGPWQPMNGNGVEIRWDQATIGNYFIRLEMIARQGRSRSEYISSTSLIHVLDSDTIAEVSPASGAILQGQSVNLKANLPELEANLNYLWSYSTSAQGSFQPINQTGSEIRWEPPRAGSYYLRIQARGDTQNAIYTSSKPLVFVAESDEIISVTPASGNIVRGDEVSLSAKLPQQAPNLEYQWFYGLSPQMPFSPISGNGQTIQWTPPMTGDFYLRVRVFNPDTQESQTFTTSKTVVSAQDSDELFTLSPNPASLLKGESVNLILNPGQAENVNWSFASAAEGPYTPIPRAGRKITWTPPNAGSFFLRAEAPDAAGVLASYTSANALVFVSDRPQPITTEAGIAELELGQAVRLSTNLADLESQGLTYRWSYGSSAQGSFQALVPIDDPNRKTVTWYPPQSGSYFIQVEVSNPLTQSSVSFTSQEPLVLVSETQSFFQSLPVPARIVSDENLTLKTRFDPQGRSFNYGWAYSKSQAGPYTPIGGSNRPEIVWDEDKPVGSYFIRFQAAAPGSDRVISYISSSPFVFVSSSENTGASFGVSAQRH